MRSTAQRAADPRGERDGPRRRPAAGLAPAMLDRLRLDDARDRRPRRARCARSPRHPSCSAASIAPRRGPNGLEVSRVRIPLGVIAMIYEARPNVTDRRGGAVPQGRQRVHPARRPRGAREQPRARSRAVQAGLAAAGLPAEAVQLVPTTDREAIAELVKLDDLIDLCIPRGGEGLIRFVAEHARVPVIKHYKGVCHVYVHAAADLDDAPSASSRTRRSQRPGVCNALETLLVDRAIAADVHARASSRGSADASSCAATTPSRALGGAACRPRPRTTGPPSTSISILAVRVVDGLAGAIAHIERYGSNHTESIVTTRRARRRAVPARGRFVDRDGQRIDPVRRRRRARPRRRDRNLDHTPPRLRPDGRRGPHHHQVRRPRQRTGPVRRRRRRDDA